VRRRGSTPTRSPALRAVRRCPKDRARKWLVHHLDATQADTAPPEMTVVVFAATYRNGAAVTDT
jgi:hypothetical protein